MHKYNATNFIKRFYPYDHVTKMGRIIMQKKKIDGTCNLCGGLALWSEFPHETIDDPFGERNIYL